MKYTSGQTNSAV